MVEELVEETLLSSLAEEGLSELEIIEKKKEVMTFINIFSVFPVLFTSMLKQKNEK